MSNRAASYMLCRVLTIVGIVRFLQTLASFSSLNDVFLHLTAAARRFPNPHVHTKHGFGNLPSVFAHTCPLAVVCVYCGAKPAATGAWDEVARHFAKEVRVLRQQAVENVGLCGADREMKTALSTAAMLSAFIVLLVDRSLRHHDLCLLRGGCTQTCTPCFGVIPCQSRLLAKDELLTCREWCFEAKALL